MFKPNVSGATMRKKMPGFREKEGESSRKENTEKEKADQKENPEEISEAKSKKEKEKENTEKEKDIKQNLTQLHTSAREVRKEKARKEKKEKITKKEKEESTAKLLTPPRLKHRPVPDNLQPLKPEMQLPGSQTSGTTPGMEMNGTMTPAGGQAKTSGLNNQRTQ